MLERHLNFACFVMINPQDDCVLREADVWQKCDQHMSFGHRQHSANLFEFHDGIILIRPKDTRDTRTTNFHLGKNA